MTTAHRENSEARATARSHRNVMRVDRRNFHGWVVQVKRRRGRGHFDGFADSRHGGPAGALRRALARRDELETGLSPATHLRERDVRSRTGVVKYGSARARVLAKRTRREAVARILGSRGVRPWFQQSGRASALTVASFLPEVLPFPGLSLWPCLWRRPGRPGACGVELVAVVLVAIGVLVVEVAAGLRAWCPRARSRPLVRQPGALSWPGVRRRLRRRVWDDTSPLKGSCRGTLVTV